MWKTLKEMVRGKQVNTKVDNIDFKIDNINVDKLSETFNIYYMKSINDIVRIIRVSQYGENRFKISYVSECLENFEMIKVEDLEKIVRNLPRKKGTGKRTTSEILKIAFYVINEKLMGLINESMRKGCYPDSWKTSTIIPIPKITKPKKASEYKPINMLPVFEKVLELVVKKQIEVYLETKEIITEYQSGFSKQHSCKMAFKPLSMKGK